MENNNCLQLKFSINGIDEEPFNQNKIKVDKYKIECIRKDKDGKFEVVCSEDELEYWINLCKQSGYKNETCCYRKYPLTKAERIYFT